MKIPYIVDIFKKNKKDKIYFSSTNSETYLKKIHEIFKNDFCDSSKYDNTCKLKDKLNN